MAKRRFVVNHIPVLPGAFASFEMTQESFVEELEKGFNDSFLTKKEKRYICSLSKSIKFPAKQQEYETLIHFMMSYGSVRRGNVFLVMTKYDEECEQYRFFRIRHNPGPWSDSDKGERAEVLRDKEYAVVGA